MTEMGAHTECFHYACSTRTTVLTGILWRNGNHGDSMQRSIVGQPFEEQAPTSIMNAFCQLVVANHVADLKIFIGNQVVRRDERVCLFSGKIFTLPLDLQIAFSALKRGSCPQRWHTLEILKLFSQEVGRTTFDPSGSVCGQRVGVGSDEEMDMIRLDGKLNNLPSLFVSYVLDNLFQTLFDRTAQNLSTPLGTPDDVVHDQVNRVLLVLLFPVDTLTDTDTVCQSKRVPPPGPSSVRELQEKQHSHGKRPQGARGRKALVYTSFALSAGDGKKMQNVYTGMPYME
jgi:hypothetical protein